MTRTTNKGIVTHLASPGRFSFVRYDHDDTTIPTEINTAIHVGPCRFFHGAGPKSGVPVAYLTWSASSHLALAKVLSGPRGRRPGSSWLLLSVDTQLATVTTSLLEERGLTPRAPMLFRPSSGLSTVTDGKSVLGTIRAARMTFSKGRFFSLTELEDCMDDNITQRNPDTS